MVKKTIRQWFLDYPELAGEQAIQACKDSKPIRYRDFLDKEVYSLEAAIYEGIIWRYSRQGYEFWATRRKQALEISYAVSNTDYILW